jgi:gliding motility-associated-like protein
LNNTSIQPSDGTIAAWSWDFGDGSAIDSIYYSSSHLYADTGEYTITLITHSSHLGCADTVEHTVVVYPKPTAGFNFINVCFHDTVHFLDSSFVSSDTIKHWSWDFGDGLPLDTLQNPDYLFGVYGIYGVKLIATTNHGCKDTAFHPVIIHPLPNVLYSSNNVCDGTTIEFASLSSVSLGDSINSYKWNFGDNTAQNNNQNASHLFDTSGSYPVTLVIVSSFGCVDSITKTSVVNPMPDVKFSVNDTIGCEPLCLSFQDVSLIATGVNAHWSWNFGDGSTLSTLQNPLHCYMSGLVNAPNIYDVTLTVTSDSGCTSSKTISNYITVYPKPHANFAPSLETSTIVNPFISFNNLSTGGDTWYWDFGDAASDTAQNPIFHEYRDTGIYVVTLIASNVYSCYDTAYKTIAIDPDFSFYIPNTFTPNGDGKNDVFEAKGVYVKDFEMSIFDRWGNLVFYSSDMTTSWDGKANLGKQTAQQDVYVYVVNLRDYKNQKHHYQGTVTVIR